MKTSETPYRRRLPDTRTAVTHKFEIVDYDGYVIVGLFEDGTPGEIFIVMAKEGSTLSGLLDSLSIMTSLALQHGVPLETIVGKMINQRFEPSGFTKNPDIKTASSIVDYVFRWIGCQFIPGFKEKNCGQGR